MSSADAKSLALALKLAVVALVTLVVGPVIGFLGHEFAPSWGDATIVVGAALIVVAICVAIFAGGLVLGVVVRALWQRT